MVYYPSLRHKSQSKKLPSQLQISAHINTYTGTHTEINKYNENNQNHNNTFTNCPIGVHRFGFLLLTILTGLGVEARGSRVQGYQS